MSVEGRLTIDLHRGPQGIAGAVITSSRPLGIVRSFAGRRMEEVVRIVPLLFNVCGLAQAAACVAACERASGVAASAGAERGRAILVKSETAREHLLRVLTDWSRHVGETADGGLVARVMHLVPAFREATDHGDLFVPGGGSAPDPDAVEAAAGRLDALLQEAVFGEAPRRWLERMHAEAFDTWALARSTGAARFVSALIERGWSRSGEGATAFLPDLEAGALSERLSGRDGESFVARPVWDGAPRETTALSRRRGEPLVACLMAESGNGLLARAAARLAEVARLPGEIRALAAASSGMREDAPVIAEGCGLAQVEAARGRLVHFVRLEAGRVVLYRVLAPTEWNFHPDGVAAAGLMKMGGGDADELRAKAGLLIEAIDPCVSYDMRVH